MLPDVLDRSPRNVTLGRYFPYDCHKLKYTYRIGQMLSIVIITMNRPEKLKRCIESVRARVAAPHEVIVIDNSAKNIGSSAARNKGAAQANPLSEYLLFLDDDAWVESLPVNSMISHMHSNPDIALMAPRILNPDGTRQASIRSFPTLSALIWRATPLRSFFPNAKWYRTYIDPLGFDAREDAEKKTAGHPKKIPSIDWAISAAILVSRKAFDSIGGFDEKYFFMHEDTDLCFRLKQRGFECAYWDDSLAYHDYARKSRNIFSSSFRHHIRGALRILNLMCTSRRETASANPR